MTSSIQCPSCRHYRGLRACAAFPKKIPATIFEGFFDHKKPYPNIKNPGDNGIRFEPIDKEKSA
jgi:hypothetical protein